MKNISLILLLTGSFHFSFSQQIHFEPVHYKGEGSSNIFTAMTQDQRGYIWIVSTDSGLYRYDGTDFVNYQHSDKNANTVGGNSIFCISTDSANYIWLGTGGHGLDRFDPATNTFIHFRHDSKNKFSLNNDTIRALTVDHLGNLWVGTIGGLDILDEKTGKFIHFSSNEQDGSTLSNNIVNIIYEDRQGTIWVGCGAMNENGGNPEEGGLNRFDRLTGKFTRYKHDPAKPNSLASNKVKSLFEDSKGNFWVGTAGDGLHIMDRERGTFTHFYYDAAHPEKLSRPPLSSNDPIDRISFIREDGQGAIWIGTWFGGINRYDPQTKQTTHIGYALKNDTAFSPSIDTSSGFIDFSAGFAFLSNDGMIWITTNYHYSNTAVYKMSMLPKAIPFYKIGKWANTFYLDSDSILWIGTQDGLIKKNVKQKTGNNILDNFINPPGMKGQIITAIRPEKENNLWVGTVAGGLYKLNRITNETVAYRFNKKEKSSLRNDSVNSMYLDHHYDLWIGTFSGLDKLDRQTGGFIHYDLEKNSEGDIGNIVNCIREDLNNNLWVGTRFGLYKLNLSNGEKMKVLKKGEVRSICIDAKNQVWVGADTTGNKIQSLYRLDRNRNQLVGFISPNSQEHIVGVFDIMEDNQNSLWIGTTYAIVLINEQRDRVIKYGADNGVHRDNFGTGDNYKSDKGQLFFGDEQGYYTFFPADLNNETKPILNFTGFKLNGTEIATAQNGVLKYPIWQTGEISLSYNQNIFSIEFKGINYQNSEGVKYQYFLKNYDQSWHKQSQDNSAYYFNVPPGKYIFQVKAYNETGGWSEKSIAILISSPWWKTWWAYTIWGLSVIAVIWGITYYRSRTLRRENRLLEDRVTRRTGQLQQSLEELKSTQTQLIQSEKMASLGELTAGIAHEIQNPLNFINNFSEVNKELIDEMEQEMDKGNLADAKTVAKNIRENEEKINHHGKRADAIVKGMLQHSRSGTGVKEPAIINILADEYLRLSYQGLRARDKSFNSTMETDYDQSIGNINIISQDIGRVLLNLYNNAFYAVSEKKKLLSNGYEPTVSVSTKKLNGKVEIRVKDNGNGIPQKVLNKIFQPFFTTKPAGQGTGLGLSLSYDIIKAHGGEIKAETEEGKFTEFVIQIPVG